LNEFFTIQNFAQSEYRTNWPPAMQQRVLAATSWPHRQQWYQDVFASSRIVVRTAASAIECVTQIDEFLPDVLILETYLHWGGSEGVLALCESNDRLKSLAVIVIDVSRDFDQTYRIGAYPIEDYWRRYPDTEELENAVQNAGALVASEKSRM
jgi:DNA-binding NtrC family response regulator